ncbi:MAG TPA: hypothetical protein VJ884_00210 [Salinibacter sp.]|nr:hypothetical protein [Salinibacter sp.]
MDAIRWVRQFFEEQLADVDAESLSLSPTTTVSTQHLISYLVDQTVQRAALDAATHGDAGSTADVSWEHCLMVAALTELRSVKLLARNQT